MLFVDDDRMHEAVEPFRVRWIRSVEATAAGRTGRPIPSDGNPVYGIVR
jgi:hypothetical protein